MRIAVSGSHQVGKSTLVDALSEAFPDHQTFDEPYHVLVEEGHELAELPTLEDFELQLRCSLDIARSAGPLAILDRCPLDLVGYLLTHDDADAFDLERWLPRVCEAVAGLDLVVFVPIEEPDRIALPAGVDLAWRRRVDDELRELVLDDRLGTGVEVLEVTGSTRRRVDSVVAHLGRAGR